MEEFKKIEMNQFVKIIGEIGWCAGYLSENEDYKHLSSRLKDILDELLKEDN